MPSLKKNVVFNYIGQFYTAFIGILILPFYLEELGAEAFGLIGFFTLLLSWLQLLDLGMTPTLGREVARLKGSSGNHFELRSVVRSLELIFIGVAVVAMAGIYLSRDWISNEWLQLTDLDSNLISDCVAIMAVMVAIRWLASLYKSGILAFEQQVWANIVEICIVTLRFPGALLLVIYSESILHYFIFQLGLAAVECLIYHLKLVKLMPDVDEKVGFSKASIVRIAPFAFGIGYTTGVWVFITQLDKLLLSNLLPLKEFGYFTLIATLSAGIMFLANPIGRAVLPRMTSLLAENKGQEMLELYINATKVVAVIVVPVVLAISVYPKAVVFIWTGDIEAAEWISDILPLYVLGYGILTIGAFQYYLQYAHGKLKQHVWYNTFSALISIPLIFYSANTYGAMGVAWVWLVFRVVALLFWAPYIHYLFAPGIHMKWLLGGIFPTLIACLSVVGLYDAWIVYEFLDSRLADFLMMSLLTTLMFVLSILVTFPREIRKYLS